MKISKYHLLHVLAEKSSYPSPRNITYIDLDAEDDCVDLTTDETLGQTKSNSSIRR